MVLQMVASGVLPEDAISHQDSASNVAQISTDGLVIPATELLARLRAAGGVLRMVDPDDRTRAAWRSAFTAAVRGDPDNATGLSFSGWRSGDVVIAVAPSRREFRP